MFKADSWKYNSNFWTAGRKTRLNETFEWCLEDESFSNASTLWAPGQPDNLNNSELCVHLHVNKTLGKVAITDKSCSNLFVLGCQVMKKPTHASS